MTSIAGPTPAKIDLVPIIIGEPYSQQFVWLSGGSPVDLSGFVGEAQIRSSVEAAAVVAAFAVTLGGTAGTITLTLAGSDTAAVANQSVGVWDLVLTSLGGQVTRLVYGNVLFRETVSR